jgi:YegS/Rv2252/BmrU family lipid kinase
MKVRFIINPNSGMVQAGVDRVKSISAAVSRVFSDEGGIFEVRVTAKGGDAEHFSAEAVRLGYDTVYACGGDGTVNEVASALVGTDTVLGIVPSGSGNGLSRALKIPETPLNAVSLILNGSCKSIDVGKVADRYFFSTAGMGFDAVLSKAYNGRLKGSRRGILPYLPIALLQFYRYKAQTLMIKWGESKLMRVSPFILTVANTSEYGASAVIAPGADPEDGLLDLCVVRELGLVGSLKAAKKLMDGEIEDVEQYSRMKSEFFEVMRDESGPMHVDGEPFEGPRRVEFSLLPKALKVWCP